MEKAVVHWGKRAFLGLIVCPGLSFPAFAIPNGGAASPKCECICSAPNGTGGDASTDEVFDSKGYSCSSFNNKTCNVQTPTGLIRSGVLLACAPVDSTATHGALSAPVKPGEPKPNPATNGTLTPKHKPKSVTHQ
jgi:hypothetical protein